jgi:hypothetical protein
MYMKSSVIVTEVPLILARPQYSPSGSVNLYTLQETTPVSSQYLKSASTAIKDILSASITFDDPTGDMLLMANELAFRLAYKTTNMSFADITGIPSPWDGQSFITSPNLSSIPRRKDQQVEIHEQTIQTVYAIYYGWLTGGCLVILVASLAILPTYWGWWELGREVSMSPLEIGRAFGAPTMQHTDPNATGDDLKKSLGSVRVCLNPLQLKKADMCTNNITQYEGAMLPCIDQSEARIVLQGG